MLAGGVLLASLSEDGPWPCLGGPVLEGETLEGAASRFPLEDCGFSVELSGAVAHLAGDRYRILYEWGQNITWTATVIEASLVSPAASVTPRMITSWFSPNEIKGLCLDEFTAAALLDLGLL
jgi:hypothetical protein